MRRTVFNDDQDAFRETVRALVAKELVPEFPKWEAAVSRSAFYFEPHNRTLLSPLPLARMVPSGANCTVVTTLVWPSRVRRVLPVVASQTFAVLSALAEARRVPSGLNAMLEIAPL